MQPLRWRVIEADQRTHLPNAFGFCLVDQRLKKRFGHAVASMAGRRRNAVYIDLRLAKERLLEYDQESNYPSVVLCYEGEARPEMYLEVLGTRPEQRPLLFGRATV